MRDIEQSQRTNMFAVLCCVSARWVAPQFRSLSTCKPISRRILRSSLKPSLYREIVAPLFVAYWERTIAQTTGEFRTAQAYTQQQLQAADGSAKGTRSLL